MWLARSWLRSSYRRLFTPDLRGDVTSLEFLGFASGEAVEFGVGHGLKMEEQSDLACHRVDAHVLLGVAFVDVLEDGVTLPAVGVLVVFLWQAAVQGVLDGDFE